MAGKVTAQLGEWGAGEGTLSFQRLLSCVLCAWPEARGSLGTTARCPLAASERLSVTPLTVTWGVSGIRATSWHLEKGEESPFCCR